MSHHRGDFCFLSPFLSFHCVVCFLACSDFSLVSHGSPARICNQLNGLTQHYADLPDWQKTLSAKAVCSASEFALSGYRFRQNMTIILKGRTLFCFPLTFGGCSSRVSCCEMCADTSVPWRSLCVREFWFLLTAAFFMTFQSTLDCIKYQKSQTICN